MFQLTPDFLCLSPVIDNSDVKAADDHLKAKVSLPETTSVTEMTGEHSVAEQ